MLKYAYSKKTFLSVVITLLFLVTLGTLSSKVLADSTPNIDSDNLGSPSIPIASGSGIVAAGTGLFSQPGTITVEVPAGAVKQVLIYWGGGRADSNITSDTISVDGNPITGELIGISDYPSSNQNVCFRAELGLDLVNAGETNTFEIDGLDFSVNNFGAGILVIYGDGTNANIEIKDGQDSAYHKDDPPFDTTEAQTFNFASADFDRTATLSMFFSSVGEGKGLRPNVIEVTADGVPIVGSPFNNLLDSKEGLKWDTLNLDVEIPADSGSLTVRALSKCNEDCVGGDPPHDLNPASMNWMTAGLSVPADEPVSCCEDDPVTGKHPKLASLLMQYTGEDCSATNNWQLDKKGKPKAKCSTEKYCLDNGMPNPAWIVVDNKKKDSKNRVWFAGAVAIGETYPIDTSGTDKSKLDSSTRVCIFGYDETSGKIGDKCQKVEFHTSCSKPLNTLDQFGANLVLECTPEDGTPPDGGEGECGKGSQFKIASLNVTYTGADCDSINNYQCDDKGCKAECDTLEDYQDWNMPSPAHIVVFNKDNEVLFDDNNVKKGDTFDISASVIGKDKLDADTFVSIVNGTENCQTLRIHTSCSKELKELDQFGSIQVNTLTLIPK